MQQMPRMCSPRVSIEANQESGNLNAKPVSTSRNETGEQRGVLDPEAQRHARDKCRVAALRRAMTLERQIMKLCSSMPPITAKIMPR